MVGQLVPLRVSGVWSTETEEAYREVNDAGTRSGGIGLPSETPESRAGGASGGGGVTRVGTESGIVDIGAGVGAGNCAIA